MKLQSWSFLLVEFKPQMEREEDAVHRHLLIQHNQHNQQHRQQQQQQVKEHWKAVQLAVGQLHLRPWRNSNSATLGLGILIMCLLQVQALPLAYCWE